MDIFQHLLAATAPINTVQIKVIGTGRTTCIKGMKRTELLCADSITRVMTYRGSLSAAVPTGYITLIDISEEMAA